jgi:hypothetical protein
MERASIYEACKLLLLSGLHRFMYFLKLKIKGRHQRVLSLRRHSRGCSEICYMGPSSFGVDSIELFKLPFTEEQATTLANMMLSRQGTVKGSKEAPEDSLWSWRSILRRIWKLEGLE